MHNVLEIECESERERSPVFGDSIKPKCITCCLNASPLTTSVQISSHSTAILPGILYVRILLNKPTRVTWLMMKPNAQLI